MGSVCYLLENYCSRDDIYFKVFMERFQSEFHSDEVIENIEEYFFV